tara:strand:- start:60 stop:230 length:171 start_codon:yes stop_codon:yes gene_type:complete
MGIHRHTTATAVASTRRKTVSGTHGGKSVAHLSTTNVKSKQYLQQQQQQQQLQLVR